MYLARCARGFGNARPRVAAPQKQSENKRETYSNHPEIDFSFSSRFDSTDSL